MKLGLNLRFFLSPHHIGPLRTPWTPFLGHVICDGLHDVTPEAIC